MANKQVTVHSDLNVTGAIIIGTTDNTDFPSNPQQGMFAVKGGSLYVYCTISGLQTWFPLIRNNATTYVQTQGAAMTTWTVVHNLGTTNVWWQVTDSSGQQMFPSGFTSIDENSFSISFTEAEVGSILVVGTDNIDVPELNAQLINCGNVSINTNGITIGGVQVLTAGTVATPASVTAAVAVETTRAMAAEAVLTAAVSAETTRATGVESGFSTQITLAQSAAGLNDSGVFTSFTGTNYLNAATSLTNGEVLLDTAIFNEVTNRTAAIGALASSLANEAQARAAADTNLQTQLTNYINAAVAGVATTETAESAARIAGDAGLQTQLNNVMTTVGTDTNGNLIPITGTNYLNSATTVFGGAFILDTQLFAVSTALNNEITARGTAVSGVATSVTTETTRAMAAEATLTTAINGKLSSSVAVTVAQGGTGASTAAGALANLGAYPASNPAGYITAGGSVANVTGIVAIANGGTGATTAANAAHNLGLGFNDAVTHGSVTATTFTGNLVGAATTAATVTTAAQPNITSVGTLTTLTVSGAASLNGTSIPTSATILVSGGALGTPVSGTLTNCTGYTWGNLSGTAPTFNQSTTGNAATATTAGNVTGTVAVANGGTGASTFAAAGIAITGAQTWNTAQTFQGGASSQGLRMVSAIEVTNLNQTTAPAATTNVYVQSGDVNVYTVAATANFIINIGWSSTSQANAVMAVGDSQTVAFIAAQGASPFYCPTIEIDGAAQTAKWEGSAGAPTSGNASGYDFYEITFIKLANNSWLVFASQTQFK